MLANYADILDAVAAAQPSEIAQIQGSRRFTWEDFRRRTDCLARTLLAHGLARQDKVAQYLYNSPEYMESLFGAVKAALVPVNTNYRYQDRELLYLWDNADVAAVSFHGCFAERIEGLRDRLPKVRVWIWVDDGSGPCPPWAIAHEAAAAGEAGLALAWERSAEDLFLIYTGGTTGMPKGVMWRQGDYFQVINRERVQGPYDMSRDHRGIVEQKRAEGPSGRILPACPQMHALGLMGSIAALVNGGSVVTLESRRFDAVEMLDAVDSEQVAQIYIVGDVFARPVLEALDAEPGRWRLDSLRVLRSSGVMWSEEVKRGLLRHRPALVLRDGLGSTEAVRVGRSESTGSDTAATATFRLGPDAAVFDDALRPVAPGSGVAGRVAVSGAVPVGYYKDPEKTAATFVTVEGRRYSIPGDYATVEADGTIRLLGRGSVCINTGGEKVFPEEVEEVLKRHPAVRDAACVGVPDPRWGEAITALVELATLVVAAGPPTAADLVTWVKADLAHYKAPKHVLFVEDLGRAANGKLDYKALREMAVERAGALAQPAAKRRVYRRGDHMTNVNTETAGLGAEATPEATPAEASESKAMKVVAEKAATTPSGAATTRATKKKAARATKKTSAKATRRSSVQTQQRLAHLTVEERVARGRAARRENSRAKHAALDLAPGRDPVALLEAQAPSRVPELLPIRYGRMLVSPFTFYRGAASIMAHDLAPTPRAGLNVQLCGDAHLSNFGAFASPERQLVIDLNDFDETLPGPFEWDLKRLATSFEIATRNRDLPARARRAAVLASVRAYREAMREFATMGNMEVWYSRLTAREIHARIESSDTGLAKRWGRNLEAATTKDSMRAFDKLTTLVDGEPRIQSDPPLIVSFRDLAGDADPEQVRDEVQAIFRRYRSTLQPDRSVLLEAFRLVDLARKVVGVGSVGTRCWILLLLGRDGDDPLFLQVKEAQASVLEPYLGKSAAPHHGQRIVEGQRLMQSSSDIFLGWLRVAPEGGLADVQRDFYVRQLWDWKISADPETMRPEVFPRYARLCGWTLARGHARSGDRIAIASYLGKSDAFDQAVADFAVAYADTNESDHAALLQAEKDGRIEVRRGL